jgi:hypothetical protein
MDGDQEQAKQYRDHADELRLTAKSTRDKKTKDIFLQLADKYDQMARTLDEIAKTDRKLAARKEK